jgi:AbiV family abortive infection protein
MAKFIQFSGRLSPQEAAGGMNAAEANASRLLEDAKLLLEANRFPTAASLAILSIEESGKVSILREIVLARSEQEAKEAWRGYRSHTKKNVTWLLPELAAKGARTLEDLRPLMDPGAEHPHLLDKIKQLGFYTDCGRDARWAEPDRVIDESFARSIVKIASLSAGRGRHTAREVELWVEHMGSVWKAEMAWMKTALSRWYQAMRAEGLEAEGPEEIDSFIWGPPAPSGTDESGA